MAGRRLTVRLSLDYAGPTARPPREPWRWLVVVAVTAVVAAVVLARLTAL